MTRNDLPILLTLTLLSACTHATLRAQPDAAVDGPPTGIEVDAMPPVLDSQEAEAPALDGGADAWAVDSTPAVDADRIDAESILDSGAETAASPCCMHWEMGAGSFSVPGCWSCGNTLRCVGTECQAATAISLCQPQPVEAWKRSKPDCY